MSGRISRHQARQRQSVAPAGIRASRGYKSVAAIRISGDFKPSPMRMAKRRFTLEELNQLMKKRDELRNKELLQAIEQSKRSFEEIMDFLNTDDSQD